MSVVAWTVTVVMVLCYAPDGIGNCFIAIIEQCEPLWTLPSRGAAPAQQVLSSCAPQQSPGTA